MNVLMAPLAVISDVSAGGRPGVRTTRTAHRSTHDAPSIHMKVSLFGTRLGLLGDFMTPDHPLGSTDADPAHPEPHPHRPRQPSSPPTHRPGRHSDPPHPCCSADASADRQPAGAGSGETAIPSGASRPATTGGMANAGSQTGSGADVGGARTEDIRQPGRGSTTSSRDSPAPRERATPDAGGPGRPTAGPPTAKGAGQSHDLLLRCFEAGPADIPPGRGKAARREAGLRGRRLAKERGRQCRGSAGDPPGSARDTGGAVDGAGPAPARDRAPAGPPPRSPAARRGRRNAAISYGLRPTTAAAPGEAYIRAYMRAGPERDEVLRQRQAPGRQIPRHTVELRDLFRDRAAGIAEPLKGARGPAGVKRRQTLVRAVLARCSGRRGTRRGRWRADGAPKPAEDRMTPDRSPGTATPV